jgi:hypothetical protein
VIGSFGALILMYLSVLWMLGHSIGERPLLTLGVLLMIVAVQFLGIGLLAELLVRTTIRAPEVFSIRGELEATPEQRAASPPPPRRPRAAALKAPLAPPPSEIDTIVSEGDDDDDVRGGRRRAHPRRPVQDSEPRRTGTTTRRTTPRGPSSISKNPFAKPQPPQGP